MDGFASSTIAALLYPGTALPSVAELAGELTSTLGVEPEPCFDGRHACALFELPDRRIALVEATPPANGIPDLSATHALFVVVGDLPYRTTPGADHLGLCEAVAHRIETRHPAEGLVLAEVDALFTPQDIDQILETVLMEYAAGATPEEPHLPALLPAPVPEPKTRRKRRLGLLDLFQPHSLSPTLADRFDREIAYREALLDAPRTGDRRQSPGPTLFPATTYGEPRPVAPPRNTRALSAFALLRKQPPPDDDELFPNTEAARARPLVHRSAIHAMNLAMVAFSLPMGAFLMTLALLGRESLAMSARMTAATGAGIGIAQDPSVVHFLAGLI